MQRMHNTADLVDMNSDLPVIRMDKERRLLMVCPRCNSEHRSEPLEGTDPEGGPVPINRHIMRVDKDGITVLAWPTREDLLTMLRTVEPGMVILLGYVDEAGDVRHLEYSDLHSD